MIKEFFLPNTSMIIQLVRNTSSPFLKVLYILRQFLFLCNVGTKEMNMVRHNHVMANSPSMYVLTLFKAILYCFSKSTIN